MTIRLLEERGTPLDQQRFNWREFGSLPISKLDDDAFTRGRIVLMNGLESEALRFAHLCGRVRGELRQALARVRRVEQHQQTIVNWLLPADQSILETTIALEQVAIEVTASVAQAEPDPYVAQMCRFGLLEHLDHLYRFAALMDRVEGKDANTIVQGYTDITPGRPTSLEHRHPDDEVRRPYDRGRARLLSKLHVLTIVGAEYQIHDYYMTVGPTFSDPVARQLYAEIASMTEQHVTHYESLLDPHETWLEQWLLHEANEAYNYWSCVESETNAQVKAVWERFLDYELGQLRFVADLFEDVEGRDAAEVLDEELSEPIRYKSHRAFVRDVLHEETGLSAAGDEIVDRSEETEATRAYRDELNQHGAPSDIVAADWIWRPGGEFALGDGGARAAAARQSERRPQ